MARVSIRRIDLSGRRIALAQRAAARLGLDNVRYEQMDVRALRDGARFMKVTTAGREESHPHDVTITKEAPNYQRG